MSAGRWEDSLPRFSLNRRVTVFVLMLSTLAFGVVATINIPLELIPQGYEAPSLTVHAPWRDAPPKEVLDKVVTPLEEELATVSGLESISSMSNTGQGRIFLSFKQGTDMDVAYREVRDRVLRAKPRLPEDLEQVRILKFNESSLPIMFIGVALDPSITDPYNLIQQEIIMPLQRIEGVASVRSEGLQEKEVIIELDREKTAAAGLNIYLVGRELGADNFSLASGSVRSGDKKLILRSLSRYRTLDEIREQLISPTVRLGDIATVRYAVPDLYFRVRVNGKAALGIEVLKEGPANTIEVSEKLTKAVAELKKNPKLKGSEVDVIFAQGDLILESLSSLLGSGQIGAIFAVMVLLFFLRRFRLTLIVTMSIPLSLVIGLIAMYFAGESLNILSMLGLIISVGMLVDNSVVVAENIHRMYLSGKSRRDACIEGASEIALAVILATATTVVVFLPVALVEGRAQFFLVRLAIPIGVSLTASLLVALVFIPLYVYYTLGRTGGGREHRAVALIHQVMDRVVGGLYRMTMSRMNAMYSRSLAFALRHRFDMVLIVVFVLAATISIPFGSLEIVEVSQEDSKSFQVRVDLPKSFGLEDAEEFFGKVEIVMNEVREELKLEGYLIIHAAQWGSLDGWFANQKHLTQAQVTDHVMKRLPKQPGVTYYSGNEQRGTETNDRLVYKIVLHGEDPDMLAQIAQNVESLVLGIDGVLGIQRSDEISPNELALVVNRERAQRQGISPQVIAGVVAAGLRGQPLPRYQEEGKEIPMRLRFAEEDRESVAELADFSVPTAAGQFVQLSSVTDVSFLPATRGIYRQGKRVSRTITVDLQDDKEREARAELDALTQRLDLPEGVRIGPMEQEIRLDEDIEAMTFALWVSIVFIYLIMGFLFESFILPMSILLTIPLASIGVAWTHYATGRDLDFLGFVGVILLVGIVVNNGIVLIDYVSRLRAVGRERTEALLMASRYRFRPIMMTAGTTIFGTIPVALGEPTSIGLSYKSFGLTLIGGMVTATALTMLVVPVFYTLFDDARVVVLGAIGRVLRRPARDAKPSSL